MFQLLKNANNHAYVVMIAYLLYEYNQILSKKTICKQRLVFITN